MKKFLLIAAIAVLPASASVAEGVKKPVADEAVETRLSTQAGSKMVASTNFTFVAPLIGLGLLGLIATSTPRT